MNRLPDLKRRILTFCSQLREGKKMSDRILGIIKSKYDEKLNEIKWKYQEEKNTITHLVKQVIGRNKRQNKRFEDSFPN